MWKPHFSFITLHYAWIICLSIVGLVVIYPYGNVRAIDAYFFGASACTESGLNTVDIDKLALYQQLAIYFIPIFGNLGVINIAVVVVRLHWFEKRLREIAPSVLRHRRPTLEPNNEVASAEDETQTREDEAAAASGLEMDSRAVVNRREDSDGSVTEDKMTAPGVSGSERESQAKADSGNEPNSLGIRFADGVKPSPSKSKALYVPSPRERDRGDPLVEVDEDSEHEPEGLERAKTTDSAFFATRGLINRRARTGLSSATLERVASSMFVIGSSPSQPRELPLRRTISLSQDANLPRLSLQASVGRNSKFHNLTAEDREQLGGVEYRSLKLLLKIVIGYYVGLHLFGAICLVPWILRAEPKYRNYLASLGQNEVWWAFYTTQTMVDNLGFTLTPDSMISFQDAVFPLLVMSFLAFAGNTFYPIFLRLSIWIMSLLVPESSSLQESLQFLLKYPRRCYTLLFPSRPTWILLGILFILNVVDLLLIILLDLHNPAVNNLPAGKRFVAALFQAANSRHTGAASFNLAALNPAVQLSLVAMMYIAAFPIAISVRASNTYEDKALGIYGHEEEPDETHGKSYVLTHIRNQLSFDLWYILLGAFCICISESGRIMDPAEPSFAIFPILFEVVSGYANVGLSLGYPGVDYSLSGEFNVFSKLVICAMMIRGRHRGLPYQLDRAILLPSEQLIDDDAPEGSLRMSYSRSLKRLKLSKRDSNR